ncbi:glycosyltransferase family 4 protein [Acidothermaceae bacterium B102]|nr:glycosyltransferase family 4 protein [Acidothermaceae bacterium B102]
MTDLLLVLGSSTGGIGTHVRSLAAECVAAGDRVTVCGPAATDELFAFTQTGAGFEPLSVGLGLLLHRRWRRALRSLIDAHGLVHAHGLQAGVVVCLVARRSGATVVVTWHNAPLGRGARRLLHVLLERVAARRADVTVGASDDLVVRARRAGARDARFVPVAPPRLQQPSADADTLRAAEGLGGAPVVLAVGRLHEQKRFDTLVAAAALWKDRQPAPVVLIAGDGPEHASLTQQADQLEVDVRLLGRRADIADLMSIADVVVLPSSWEARPLVAQEALAAGRALVATPVGGVPSLVGSAAVLVPVGNPAAIASAVLRLLDDDDYRRSLERDALSRASRWPDAHDVAVQLRAIYGEAR